MTMPKNGYTEEETLRALRDTEAGKTSVTIRRQRLYLWKKKYVGLGVRAVGTPAAPRGEQHAHTAGSDSPLRPPYLAGARRKKRREPTATKLVALTVRAKPVPPTVVDVWKRLTVSMPDYQIRG
jgi:hypothetical protein